MPKPKSSLALTGYDEIFGVDVSAPDTDIRVQELPLSSLHLPEHFPFKIREDAAMSENVEEIKCGGAIIPCLVRPCKAGGHEIVTGQRTVRACEIAGRETVPCIVRELDDDSSIILMVNANLPQDTVLPGEMAWALRMKLEALCHRGRKVEGIDPGTLSVEILVEQTGKSKNQIYRYVHLTELSPALLDMVDEGAIAFSVAADYLYKLKRREQAWLLDSMEKYEATPSASQALRLKKHSQSGALTAELVDEVMAEQKKEPIKVTLGGNCLRQYFSDSYTPKQMEDIIISLLDSWQKTQKASA